MKKLFFIIIVSSIIHLAQAQAPSDSSSFVPQYKRGVKYQIKTNIGTVHTGFIVNETKEFITLEYRSTQDRMEIRKTEILNSKILSQRKNVVLDDLGENEHADVYMIANSAFLFESEASTSHSHWFIFENMDYAFNENWAMTANTIAFYPVSIGLKAHFKIDETNFFGANVCAMGDLFARTVSRSAIGFWGITGHVEFTHGTSNHNFTVMGGLLGLNSELFPGIAISSPLINLAYGNISYCNRFSKSWAFNGEGWFFPESQSGLGGLAFKFLRDENVAWNFGCYMFVDNYKSILSSKVTSFPLPYIGYSRKFN